MKQIYILILFTFLSFNASGMQIFIYTPNNGIISLEVLPNEPIENVKDKIQDAIGIDPVSQILKFNDIILDNGNTLYDYNITSDSTLQLTDSTLGILDIELDSNKINLYPNPSSRYIQITGLTKRENYIIYNSIGNVVINKTIFNNGKIEIKNLTDGLYFLKFDNGNTLKFIKK